MKLIGEKINSNFPFKITIQRMEGVSFIRKKKKNYYIHLQGMKSENKNSSMVTSYIQSKNSHLSENCVQIQVLNTFSVKYS